MQIHFVTNRKGGVGKTTLTVYLAAAVALQLGEPVLVVDTDPQNNAAMLMGVEPHRYAQASLQHYLEGGGPLYRNIIALDEFVGCELLAADHYETGEQAAAMQRLFTDLRTLSYAHVFIDSPPTFTPAQEVCLRFCDTVLVPVQPSYLAVGGLNFLVRSLYRAVADRERMFRLRVVVNHRYLPSAAVLDGEAELRRQMGDLVFQQAIPFSYWFDRCAAEGVSVLRRGRGPVVTALHRLAAEFLAWVSEIGGEEPQHGQVGLAAGYTRLQA